MEKKKTIFQIPATLSGFSGLAHKTLKLTFHTQEELDSESTKRMCDLHEKTGWLSFNVEKIEAVNLANLPTIKAVDTDGKSPSQRLRSIIYVLWEKNGKQGIFEDYYIKCLGRFQKQVKDELDKLD